MGPLSGLEKALAGVFKGAPSLPKGFISWLVKYLPWLAILGAVSTFWVSWLLWDWAHSPMAEWLNTWAAYYEGLGVDINSMDVGMWISFVILLISGALYLLAFPGLKAKRKAGWNLLFLGVLINLVYGIVVAFTDYGGASNLIGSILGAGIGWYVLFQIRDNYSITSRTKVSETKK